MQYALMTEPQMGGTYDDLLALANWAEAAGLAAFARSDHYLNQSESAHATDALASLAGLARDTTRIGLTVLVTPLTFRHPAVIAKTAATIDEMSGGRLELGIGTGWMDTEHDAFGLELPELRERFSRLYETLAYVAAAFGRSGDGFHGRHYRLAEIDVLPRPTGRLPIIVGGSGTRRTPEIAGRFGDEYNTFADDLHEIVPRLDTMRAAARDANRDPDEILVSVAVPMFFGADEGDYRDVLVGHAARRGREPAELERRLEARALPHGPPGALAEFVAACAAVGVGRIYLQEYSGLAEIDTDRLTRILAALPDGAT